MNENRKIYDDSFHFFKHLIIFLLLIQTNLLLNPRYKHILFSELNQIILKVKGSGNILVINLGYNDKPSSYFLNNDSTPKTINGSSIELSKTENEVTLIFTNPVSTCYSMFKGCSQIIEIDFSNFDSSNVRNIDRMFYDCTSLKSIKFGNFQTSNLNIMEYVFYNCPSLEALDLSSFDTSKVTDFHYMFYGCSSLKYLDLSNFNTSSCICTYDMFNGCTSITSINLSSFDTSKVTLMCNMFYDCKNLVSLDLSSFDNFSNLNNLKFLLNKYLIALIDSKY